MPSVVSVQVDASELVTLPANRFKSAAGFWVPKALCH